MAPPKKVMLCHITLTMPYWMYLLSHPEIKLPKKTIQDIIDMGPAAMIIHPPKQGPDPRITMYLDVLLQDPDGALVNNATVQFDNGDVSTKITTDRTGVARYAITDFKTLGEITIMGSHPEYADVKTNVNIFAE